MPAAERAIANIEAGELEIRPGLSNVLKAMSRIAPQFMLKQMAKMGESPRSIQASNQRSLDLIASELLRG